MKKTKKPNRIGKKPSERTLRKQAAQKFVDDLAKSHFGELAAQIRLAEASLSKRQFDLKEAQTVRNVKGANTLQRDLHKINQDIALMKISQMGLLVQNRKLLENSGFESKAEVKKLIKALTEERVKHSKAIKALLKREELRLQ